MSSLDELGRRFVDFRADTSRAEDALARLSEAAGVEPPPARPPAPPRTLLKPPDTRKRRRHAVQTSRRANRG